MPAAKLGDNWIEAFQNPPVPTTPPLTVKPTVSPFISNRMLAGSTVPSICSNPLPLSEVICPEILNVSPATGFAAISSTTKNVNDRTFIVEKFALVPNKSELPMKVICTVAKPSGWVNGIVWVIFA